jgi:hypothetical protein
MRIRYSILIIPLVVAACASSAGSPSPAAPSAAAPSVAPSEAPSMAPSAAAPSAAPSEAAASPDPFAAFRDDTLKPTVEQVTTALPQFGEAFTAAAAADASDTDKIAFATAAFKLRVALQSGTAILAEEVADLPECGVEAQTQAQGFFATLTEDSQDLLAATTADPDQAGAVTEFVEKASASASELTTAIDQACA